MYHTDRDISRINTRWIEGDLPPEPKQEPVTTKQRFEKQRDNLHRQSEQDWKYIQENEDRYAKQRAKTEAKHCTNCTLQIDHRFIGQLEGTTKTGYVPAPEKSKSGVTIGTGFDLGARSLEDIKTLGFSQELTDKLTPYLGLKKNDAVKALKERPRTITDSELTVVVKAVKKSETSRVVRQYNAASDIKIECLPPQAQTVIASVAYQYGTLATETPRFWKQSIKQDWSGMYQNLMNFGDAYPTRRRKEAALLKELL